MKHKCTRCGKPIATKIKIVVVKKKVGKKIVQVIEMYDEDCFLIKNKEGLSNGRHDKKGTCKKVNCK